MMHLTHLKRLRRFFFLTLGVVFVFTVLLWLWGAYITRKALHAWRDDLKKHDIALNWDQTLVTGWPFSFHKHLYNCAVAHPHLGSFYVPLLTLEISYASLFHKKITVNFRGMAQIVYHPLQASLRLEKCRLLLDTACNRFSRAYGQLCELWIQNKPFVLMKNFDISYNAQDSELYSLRANLMKPWILTRNTSENTEFSIKFGYNFLKNNTLLIQIKDYHLKQDTFHAHGWAFINIVDTKVQDAKFHVMLANKETSWWFIKRLLETHQPLSQLPFLWIKNLLQKFIDKTPALTFIFRDNKILIQEFPWLSLPPNILLR